MSAAIILRASLPPVWEAPSRTIRELRLALVSKTQSLGYAILHRSLSQNCSEAADAPPHRYSAIQLEYVACLLHCEFEELGGHLEQVPYAHEIWRAKL